ncbi:hypothetical protein [Methylocystis rosea]|uniref:hypothetical protein n=1 Tax=Methylocystis rosea TaxID=173366 RepID=UPI00036285D2|nr:hypothetical protein [Methylocystis rosea]
MNVAEILFLDPLTTCAWPCIIASNPSRGTPAALAFLAWPTRVSNMSARRKKSVSVAPGMSNISKVLADRRASVHACSSNLVHFGALQLHQQIALAGV